MVFFNHRSIVRESSLYKLTWRMENTCYYRVCNRFQQSFYWDHPLQCDKQWKDAQSKRRMLLLWPVLSSWRKIKQNLEFCCVLYGSVFVNKCSVKKRDTIGLQTLFNQNAQTVAHIYRHTHTDTYTKRPKDMHRTKIGAMKSHCWKGKLSVQRVNTSTVCEAFPIMGSFDQCSSDL